MSKYTIYRDLWGWKFHILIMGGAGMKAGDLKRIIDKKKENWYNWWQKQSFWIRKCTPRAVSWIP